MHWIPLPDIPDSILHRGSVLRFAAGYPFEAMVDFMLVLDQPGQDRLRLICATGYHAGRIELILPDAAHAAGGISRDWLLANWQTWIWPQTPAEQVRYLPNYPEPQD